MSEPMDEPGEDQIRVLRQMTPEQRVKAGIGLWRFARRVKLASLREQHPQLSQGELQRLLNEAFSRAGA
jgi:hypothetical protein